MTLRPLHLYMVRILDHRGHESKHRTTGSKHSVLAAPRNMAKSGRN